MNKKKEAMTEINNKTSPILFEKKEDCCGCSACVSVCPKRAINMVRDVEGFEYPRIDSVNCINCGLCLKACPIKKIIGENRN